MHYFQMAFLAHEHQEELLRKAHEGRLAHALRSANRDDGLLHHLAGLLRASQSTPLAELASKRMGKLLPVRLGMADRWHRGRETEVRPG
jgi:hypothetical protein